MNDLASDSISVPTISNIGRGITGNLASKKVAYIREKLVLTDEKVHQLLKNTKEENERFAQKIANVRYLVELNLLSEARQEISALQADDKLGDYRRYTTTIRLSLFVTQHHLWDIPCIYHLTSPFVNFH